MGCSGSSSSRATRFLARDDLVQPLGLHDADRGGELADPEVEAGDRVVGLAVVAKRACVVEQLADGARPACRPRRSRSSSSRRTSRRRRRPTCPGACRSRRRRGRGRSPRSGRSRGRGSRRRSARRRRRCGRRCGRGTPPAARWPRPCATKSSNDMQRSSRLQSTNTGRAAGALDRQRGRHEGVRGAEDLARPRRRRSRAPPARRRSSRRRRRRRGRYGRAQAASNRSVSRPLRPALGGDDPSQSACRRGRSRRSKPIAKLVWSRPGIAGARRYSLRPDSSPDCARRLCARAAGRAGATGRPACRRAPRADRPPRRSRRARGST